MTADEIAENGRRLDLIDRLKSADDVARILKSQTYNGCVAIARLADQIGQRGVGASVWNHVRRITPKPQASA